MTHAEQAQIQVVAVCCLLDEVALEKQLFVLLEEFVHTWQWKDPLNWVVILAPWFPILLRFVFSVRQNLPIRYNFTIRVFFSLHMRLYITELAKPTISPIHFVTGRSSSWAAWLLCLEFVPSFPNGTLMCSSCGFSLFGWCWELKTGRQMSCWTLVPI